MAPQAAAPVIVFDGICLLCSRWVSFLLKHDHAGRFHFAAMQSAYGRKLLARYGLDPDSPLSFLLVEEGRGYTDTRAIVRVLRGLGQRRWRWLGNVMGSVPRGISDPAYRFIARHRYRIFGQRRSCFVPTPEQRARFSL